MNTKDLTTVSIFTALTAIGAFISFPLGPVPVTLQTFFVLLCGLILKPKQAFLSQLLYMIIGLVGIPIFAGFKGGPQQIFSLTFGFVTGFILAAFIVSIIFNKLSFSKFAIIISVLIGTLIIYLVGLSHMYFIFNFVMGSPMTFFQVFKVGCLTFLPGDLLKAILVSIIAYKLIPIVNKDKNFSY